MNLVPFVPDHHTHDFIVVAPIQSRSRTACLRCRYLRGPLQPAARGLMNGFVELASRRVRQGATALMRDRDILQSNFSRADACIVWARTFLIEAMSGLTDVLAENGPCLI